MAIESINPATEAVLASFQEHTQAQIEQALGQAWATFQQWRETGFAERGRLLRRAGAVLQIGRAHV